MFTKNLHEWSKKNAEFNWNMKNSTWNLINNNYFLLKRSFNQKKDRQKLWNKNPNKNFWLNWGKQFNRKMKPALLKNSATIKECAGNPRRLEMTSEMVLHPTPSPSHYQHLHPHHLQQHHKPIIFCYQSTPFVQILIRC